MIKSIKYELISQAKPEPYWNAGGINLGWFNGFIVGVDKAMKRSIRGQAVFPSYRIDVNGDTLRNWIDASEEWVSQIYCANLLLGAFGQSNEQIQNYSAAGYLLVHNVPDLAQLDYGLKETVVNGFLYNFFNCNELILRNPKPLDDDVAYPELREARTLLLGEE